MPTSRPFRSGAESAVSPPFQKLGSLQAYLAYFSRKNVSKEDIVALDRKDERILELLQSNNRLNADQIGDAIGLSPTAVTRRIKRLRDKGLIEADVAILSLKAVGPLVTVLLLCTLDPNGPSAVTPFGEHVRGRPEVINAYYVAGTPDVALEVITRTIEEYYAFLNDLSEKFPNLADVQSWIVLDRLKRSFALPFAPSRVE
jgi:Lrp/AsnC family transcriptional regulator, leucine-responsive regulatory protein